MLIAEFTKNIELIVDTAICIKRARDFIFCLEKNL